jgi:hypothetical protein
MKSRPRHLSSFVVGSRTAQGSRVNETPWDVLVMPPARRQIDRLPISAAAAVIERSARLHPTPSVSVSLWASS